MADKTKTEKKMKKALGETQTLRALTKTFRPAADPFPGRRTAKI